MEIIMPVLVYGGAFVGILLFLALLFNAFYKKIPQGYAMIVNDMSAKPKVYFTGGFVLPVVHKMEVMKVSLITLELDRRAKDGLICKDNLRADINVAFYLRVNETQDDVLKVAKAIGVDRASDREAVNELFNAKFSEALKTVGKKMNFLELFENRIQFREQIIEVIGQDLNGYVLEDVAIDYLEQTPRSALDPHNILDSEGIRRITEVTATQSIETNRLEKDEQLAISKKNVETREALLALERQEADAVARQKREVETLKAREEAETLKVQQEERLKSEEARIRTEEEISVQDVNKDRQVEIASKAKERALAIEEEKVIKARELEAVNREREVELQRIDKEKALEEERKIIANTVSERIAVEKKVAEEEERIKEVRAVSEADRQKQVRIVEAEAVSEEEKIKQVKAAEAEEQQAVHKAKEIQLMAQAELDASSKKAEAAKKKAEGDQASHAAAGLAAAKVQAANAEANEKEGLAEARIIEAQAMAREKEGLMQAKVLEERLNAEANGLREQGLAEAEASREKGLADAAIIRERANAEADGLIAKFNAMNNMSTEAREFEEFKMRLEAALTEVKAKLETNKEISKDQAAIMASAFENSNIDIIGGDGDYFNKMASGMGMGKAIDGLLTESPMLQQIMQKFMTSGKAHPPADKVN